MLEKLKNLMNIKAWLENFVLKTLVNKTTKHATTFLTGFLAGPLFMFKVKPILDHWGITVDAGTLAMSLGAAVSGLSGYVVTWIVKILDKDGDGRLG